MLFCRHSPFRQHKTKDKHEIDRMTMTMVSSLCNLENNIDANNKYYYNNCILNDSNIFSNNKEKLWPYSKLNQSDLW